MYILKTLGKLIICFICFTGCIGTEINIKGNSSSSEKQKDLGPIPFYHDFGDVLIPGELKVDNKSTFIYRTNDFSAGVLVLKGRVELKSLISFFENNMLKDNWKMVSSIKSQRTMLFFRKTNRSCVMILDERDFNTHVEIWVAPTIPDSGE